MCAGRPEEQNAHARLRRGRTGGWGATAMARPWSRYAGRPRVVKPWSRHRIRVDCSVLGQMASLDGLRPGQATPTPRAPHRPFVATAQ